MFVVFVADRPGGNIYNLFYRALSIYGKMGVNIKYNYVYICKHFSYYTIIAQIALIFIENSYVKAF